MKRQSPNPAAHLSDPAKTWWRSVQADYALEPHHQHLLRLACEAWDRCQQARAMIDAEGLTIRDDRGNLRAHPAVAIEKDARTAFARLLRELDLDVEAPPSAERRPPALRSNRRG
jgi:P27 family predicted phage terminase small subunit